VSRSLFEVERCLHSEIWCSRKAEEKEGKEENEEEG
jgi:hypothetical protein